MSIQTVCVVGAGNMGSGIAQACAQAGFDVRLVDQDKAIVEKSRDRMAKGLQKLVERGRYTNEEVDAIVGRVAAHDDINEAAKDIDLAIEAVFESMEVKSQVFSALDKAAPPEAILATNTSSLSVTEIAKHTQRPDRVAGLHFFFPAMINKLLEVVKGDGTSQETFDALMDASTRMGKVAIETTDSPGFCVNRFFVPMLNEACRLREEGHGDCATIDAAANRLLGTPMGPFQLMNVTGVQIALHAQRTLHEAFGPFYAPAPSLVARVEEKQGDWDLTGEPDAAEFEYVEERLMGVTVGISAQLVEEGVATVEDTEKGATVGLAWSRGPFSIANERGTHRALSAVSAIYMRHGDDFPVAQSLRSLGSEDRLYPIKAVSLRKDGPIGRITIERPGQLNALNTQVLSDLEDALDAFAEDETLRVAVITGEGKAFVAGADLKEMAEADPTQARAFTELGQRVFRHMETIDKPVLAAVNGFAFGGGLELALACDVVYASERAQVGLPEVGLGIIPGFGGTQRLARRIGIGKARRLVYTGHRLDAEAALQIGIVDAVLPASGFLSGVMKDANAMAANAPLAIGYAKRAMRDGPDVSLPEGLDLEKELAIATFGTEDQREGFRAFAERRKPSFQGR